MSTEGSVERMPKLTFTVTVLVTESGLDVSCLWIASSLWAEGASIMAYAAMMDSASTASVQRAPLEFCVKQVST